MPYNHGIRVTENPTAISSPILGTAGLQVVFGTAPINTVANPSAAVNKLILANSFSEAKEALGYSEDFENYTLCQVMYAAFKLFGVGPVIFCNVLDPSNANHKTAVAAASYSVTNKQAVVNVLGMIHDSTLVVKDGENTLIEDTDYTVSFDNNGYLVVTILAASTHATATSLTINGNKLNPSGVTANDVIGGTTGGVETGIELIRQVFPKFGMTPGIISAPGYSKNTTVGAALSAKTTDINGKFKCMALIDLETTTTNVYSSVPSAKTTAGYISEHDIILWPMIKTTDGKKLAYSAIYGSLMAYTDASNDDIPSMSPSNKLMSIGGTCLESGTDVVLDEVQANTLNEAGVVTAINQAGWRTWGNNTACYPSVTDPKDRWICCRRFFSWWENSFILTYMEKVDDLANYKLIESIVDAENIRGNSYVAQGKVAGVHMEFDPDDNPVSEIIAGHIKFKTYLAPYTPAEDILNEFEFDPTMITAALTQ